MGPRFGVPAPWFFSWGGRPGRFGKRLSSRAVRRAGAAALRSGSW